MSAEARLSRLLFLAREQIEMWADVITAYGEQAEAERQLVAEIDLYRAEQGWSATGYGDEDSDMENPGRGSAPGVPGSAREGQPTQAKGRQ